LSKADITALHLAAMRQISDRVIDSTSDE